MTTGREIEFQEQVRYEMQFRNEKWHPEAVHTTRKLIFNDLDFNIRFMQRIEIEIVIQIEIVKQSQLCVVFCSCYVALS